ncbi:GNAT family N-acetyltransferase [Flaviflexus huanghaiensis]|uniref:GNAT family N-acetyltransferase n=1 Tax=Flaviflexus huanghaiensis TaxID=1111473 RepID=UPI0015FA6C57|nr:GNAT family N-acetyltransferase [Flaviflexus huanghaiensis]
MERASLTTTRLRLEVPTLELTEDLAQICQDPEIQRWTTVPSQYGVDDAAEFLSSIPRRWNEDCPVWAIYADDLFVGLVDLYLPVGQGRRTEVGFWANPEARGHGYMTEAVRAVCEFAFERGCFAIGWACAVEGNDVNWASAKVAWRNGFVFEGIQRAAVIEKGKIRNYLRATLLPCDAMEPAEPWFGPSPGRRPVWNPKDPEALVREFHETYAMPIADDGPNVDRDRTHMRMALIAEEFHELVAAVYGEAAGRIVDEAYGEAVKRDDNSRDTVETADALADLIYVIYGMALETGIPLADVLREVQAANLSKLGEDGKPIYRPDGKVMKGPAYFRPRVDRVLGFTAD